MKKEISDLKKIESDMAAFFAEEEAELVKKHLGKIKDKDRIHCRIFNSKKVYCLDGRPILSIMSPELSEDGQFLMTHKTLGEVK